MESWKKHHNLSPDTKIFICKGSYYDMKVALEDRGWFENKDYRSPCFDLKWTCKSTDAYSTALNENQIVNHYRNNDGYTTKSGLSRNLKNLINKDIDIDNFFPKCYDLYDQQDFEDFIEEFKFSFAVSQLILFQKQKGLSLSLEEELKLKTILHILDRKLYPI
jgi:tubulin monoglycylase TTLL3/8